MRKLKESDGTVEGTVIQVNRGGALVSLEKLRGFVPSSHLGSYTLGDELVGALVENKKQKIKLVYICYSQLYYSRCQLTASRWDRQ